MTDITVYTVQCTVHIMSYILCVDDIDLYYCIYILYIYVYHLKEIKKFKR